LDNLDENNPLDLSIIERDISKLQALNTEDLFKVQILGTDTLTEILKTIIEVKC
jgi:hypothetical protein